MNMALMREKMKERELQEIEQDNKSYLNRFSTTFQGARSNYPTISEKYSLWIFSILAPYVLGFVLITILCLSLVDISLDSYFTILVDNFSVFGLWTIGYFILSIFLIVYLFGKYVLDR